MTNTFNVQSMTCDHCEKVVADRTQNRVEVSSSQPPEALKQAIIAERYTVVA